MKIEVTFDKTTKREFRDQCIKRLQDFVSQIHGDKENSNTKRNQHMSIQEGKCQDLRIQVESALLGQEEKKMRRGEDKYGNSLKKQSGLSSTNNHFITDKKYKTPQDSRIQRIQMESTVNSECESPRESFNITAMKDKVSKILQKFEKTQKVQSKNQKNIEEQLFNTNRKLDCLIKYIQEGNMITTSRPCSDNQPSRDMENTSFQQKFNSLAKRYQDIKQRGTRPTTNRMSSSFQKSIESLSATQDSLTFRRN